MATSAAGTTPPVAIPTTVSMRSGKVHWAIRPVMSENEIDVMDPARNHAATSLVTYDATPSAQSPISGIERVNLILFEPSEIQQPLPITDRRAHHILAVLRRRVGDTFDVGVVNGSRGRATLQSVTSDILALGFEWTEAPRIADPITLIVGLPRPQTARDILRDATTLGVAAIHFVRTDRSDPSYA